MQYDEKDFIVTNKQGFFSKANAYSTDEDLRRHETIKNEFKLRQANAIANKNKEDDAIRYKNWQLFFKQMAYLLWLIPTKKTIKKKRLRSKRRFNSKIKSSQPLFFKDASVKHPAKMHIEPSRSNIASNEIDEKAIRAHAS